MKTTAERLKEILKIKNLKQVDILRLAEPYCKKYMVKLNKSDLSQFVSGKVVPGQFKLKILALALDINEAWLMGYDDVPMERSHTGSHNYSDELIHSAIHQTTPYDKLTQTNKAIVDQLIISLLASQAED